MTKTIPAGSRVGRPSRPMPPDHTDVVPGLAGRLLYCVAGHIPLLTRLPDRRIELILEDLELELSRYDFKEAHK